MRLVIIAILLSCSRPTHAALGDGGIFIVTGTELSTKAYTHFYIENELGQRAGRLPDGTLAEEIPGTIGAYGTESVDNHGEGSQGDETIRFELSPFPAGLYKLRILPSATTSYFLNFTIRNDNLSRSSLSEVGYAATGVTITYNFTFQPDAPTPSGIVKNVTFISLRQSIQASHHLGQLGDSAFVSRLDKMITKAETFAAKGQNKQAADRLDQFIHRLESAFKKEPDPNADDDPADKKSADSMKRFISSQARSALQADARVLIISLGETPKK